MDERVEVSTDEARAGTTPRMTRYILAMSLALVVILFVGLLLIYR